MLSTGPGPSKGEKVYLSFRTFALLSSRECNLNNTLDRDNNG